MRVLVTTPVFPPDLGGPAVYVPSFARFLVERGHEVKVVAFCSDPAPSGYPFEVVSIVPRGPLPLRYIKAFFVVLREARGSDVAYVNEHLALLHVLATRLRRVPTAIRIMVDGAWEISHRKGWCGDDDIVTFQGKRYGWKVSLTRSLQKRWWKWCRHIVACSEFLRQILIQSYGVAPQKVQRIFNAYHGPEAESVPQSRGEARDQVGLDRSKRYLLTICRLMVWKKVDGILHALAGLPEDVHLLVVGEGDMEGDWRRLAAELGLQDRAHFLGNQAYDRIPLYLRATDIFVLNSRYEGLSHTLLEALHLGTPVVASGVCGNPEVVEHEQNGLLVDPLDATDLRQALERLLDDPELGEQLARAGLKRRADFRREATFAMVEGVLHDLADRPVRARPGDPGPA